MPFMAALGIAQLAAPLLGGLFGGGAPTFDDLTQNTRDTSNMLTGAARQSQDLRQGQIDKSQRLRVMDIENARGVGAFDPTSLGAGGFGAGTGSNFGHLAGIIGQFEDADFGANAIRKSFDREMQILDRVNQMASQAASMNLGIDEMLMQGGQQAGAGVGAGIGGMLGAAGNMATGAGFGSPGGALAGLFGGGGGSGVTQAMPTPPLPGMGGGGGTAQSFPVTPAPSGGGFSISPMIQAILQGIG